MLKRIIQLQADIRSSTVRSAIISSCAGATDYRGRKQIIEEHFDSVSGEEDWSPRYNIAPTQPIPVIRQNPKEPIRQLSLMRWGLIPSLGKGHVRSRPA